MLYNLREEGSDTLELDIFQDIGEGGFFFDAISAQQVRNRLKARADAKTIRVTINSKGGEVMEGLAIYEDLRSHAARVEVKIQALAASIASVIAMAGDEIAIAPTGFIMMHGVVGGARGDANFLEDTADAMRKAQAAIAGVYQRRSKQPLKQINAWLSRETYMTAEEALANGFVDRIDEKITTPKAQAKAFAMFNSATLDDAPEALLTAIRGAQKPETEPEPEPEPEPLAPTEPVTPPAPSPAPSPEPIQPSAARADEPENSMSFSKKLTNLLTVADDADDAAVCAAIERLKASARTGTEIEQLLGATGAAAVGAVRGLKDSQEQLATLQNDLGHVKATMSRNAFENAIAQGKKERKLNPANAARYVTKFDAAIAAGGDGSEVVEDLKGFLAVAHPFSIALVPPRNDGPGGHAPQHDGKAFENMKPAERSRLKRENRELYDAMREDALERQAI